MKFAPNFWGIGKPKYLDRLGTSTSVSSGVAPFYPGASVALDFTRNQYRVSGIGANSTSNIPGWSFTRASTGYAETSAGVLVPFASGQPRITDKGLLVEEARTNLLLRSQEFDSVSWGKTNITVTPNAALAPDGTLTADKIEATATALTNFSQGNAGGGAAAGNSYSIFIKKGSGATEANRFILRNTTTATNLLYVSVNYDTGAITYNTGVSGASMTAVGGGWWRLTLSVSSGISAGDSLIVYAGFVGPSENAGTHFYAWGAQLEAGSFATSYIPTAGSTATRAADLPIIVGAYSFPMTVVLQFTPTALSTTASSIFLTLDDGTISERVWLYNDSATPGFRSVVTAGGASQASLNGGAISLARQKGATRIGTNDVAVSFNAGAVVSDSLASMPTVTQMVLGTRPSATNSMTGYLEGVAIYPRLFSNAELQAVTA